MDVPPQVPLLYDENFNAAVTGKPAAPIAYGDLSHPIDQVTSEMYAPFVHTDLPKDPKIKEYVYRKFAMWDGIIETAKCDNVDYELDTASTTLGSSGALVLGIFKDAVPPRQSTSSNKTESPGRAETDALGEPTFTSLPSPLAIGMHKCCAAYFGEEDAYGPPPTIPCASLHRTPFNQNVSSKSILEEPRFCKLLYQSVIIKDVEGDEYHLECSDQSVVVKKGSRKPMTGESTH